MNGQELFLFIDRIAKAFATQANQIRALQTLLMEQGVKPEEFSECQKFLMTRHFTQDVQFFKSHLLGQFSGQERTKEEEQKLLDAWWKLDQQPPKHPEESEGSPP